MRKRISTRQIQRQGIRNKTTYHEPRADAILHPVSWLQFRGLTHDLKEQVAPQVLVHIAGGRVNPCADCGKGHISLLNRRPVTEMRMMAVHPKTRCHTCAVKTMEQQISHSTAHASKTQKVPKCRQRESRRTNAGVAT